MLYLIVNTASHFKYIFLFRPACNIHAVPMIRVPNGTGTL